MKSIEHIPVRSEWESENDWDSHRPALYLTLTNTTGTVLELGCGEGSTRLLDESCKKLRRKFWSFDTNKEWAEKYWTVTNHVQDYFKSIRVEAEVVFIDCAPGELRKELIEAYKDRADVIVAHDTEQGAIYVYGMEDILNTFKYRLDYLPVGKPATTIVSNKINVEDWI